MAHNLANQATEYIIFAYSGKTMIGVIDKEETPQLFTTETIPGIMGNTKNTHYNISNPCIIEFTLTTPNTGSSTINWKLTPMYFVDLIGDSNVKSVKFAFNKEEVTLSTIGGSTINANLLSAYKELCEMRLG